MEAVRMRSHVKSWILAGAAVLAFSSGLRAQMEQQAGAAKAPSASAPAPVHDLSGVWNMRATPAQRKFPGSTYTLEAPEMTPWAKAKNEAAQPSNGPRSNALKVTDHTVPMTCRLLGPPRIYLQPCAV